jgi:hypothetical protein
MRIKISNNSNNNRKKKMKKTKMNLKMRMKNPILQLLKMTIKIFKELGKFVNMMKK